MLDDGDLSIIIGDSNQKEQSHVNNIPEISSFQESDELLCHHSFEQQYEEMIKQQLGGLFEEYIDYRQRT